MKEIVVSNCEKAFAIKAATEGTRLDGRRLDESRSLQICFGESWGSCHVALGETKVAAHVSHKIEQPKQSRPNEGILIVNVEPGPMGAPNFENRQSDLHVYLGRLIEKCIYDSRCVDLESLCIVSEEKVWSLRVDIHVLNHAGNIIECASVAALACLAHFKRPDITTDGEEIIIHTLAEKDPIPTVLHHYPVCVTFGFFNEEVMVADPNLLEQIVCSSTGAIFVVGMNSYREVCLFDLASAAITLGPEHVYRASQQAAQRASYLVNEIKNALTLDSEARTKGDPVGFSFAISTCKLTTLESDKLLLRLNNFSINMSNEDFLQNQVKESISTEDMVIVTDDQVAALVPKDSALDKNGIWAQMGSEDEKSDAENDNDDDIQIIENPKSKQCIVVNSDSEEEEVVILNTENLNKMQPKKKKKKGKK